MKRVILPSLALAVAVSAPRHSATSQQVRETSNGVEVEKDIALLRRDLRVEKKKIIAANLPLTETEATKFWPVYDQYITDITKPYDEFYALVKDYAANQKTMSDAQAAEMAQKWAGVAVQLAQTRAKYVPIVGKVLPGKKTALFFQLDRRLYSMVELQVMSEIPLIVP